MQLLETAVSWVRHRLTRTTPKSAAEETREEYVARLKQVCADINATLDVESLCWGFPARVEGVRKAEGDRLTK